MPTALRPRKITTHTVNEANELLEILVLDLPGAGGANHEYTVRPRRNPGEKPVDILDDGSVNEVSPTQHFPYHVHIPFQNGTIPEAGVNGITHEILLAIVADRLESFQAGKFPSTYNEVALAAVKAALASLKQRTIDRQNRGVEGKHQA